MNLAQVKANPFLLDRLNHSGRQDYYKQGYRGKNVVVCLIDTGVANHDEFVGRDINITGDTKGHGSAMAGLIIGNNIGIAPESKVLAYKREDEYLYSVVNGMKFARNWRGSNGEKVNIISLSVSSSSSYGEIYEEVRACTEAGILIVCSSGNSGMRDITFPASYDETLCVGACTNKQEVATWESSGEMVDICTYGEKVITANHLNTSDYNMSDGTSPSTAIVAGLCALYYSKYYAMYKTYPTPLEAKRFMMMQSVDLGIIGKDIYFGWGFATLDGRVHKRIELQINSDVMKINGITQSPLLQVPFITPTGSTVVPLRACMEAGGYKVEWINEGQRIILTN